MPDYHYIGAVKYEAVKFLELLCTFHEVCYKTNLREDGDTDFYVRIEDVAALSEEQGIDFGFPLG